MPSRIVVFGATGYTGRLVAERLAGQGERPVLAGAWASVTASRAGKKAHTRDAAGTLIPYPAAVLTPEPRGGHEHPPGHAARRDRPVG